MKLHNFCLPTSPSSTEAVTAKCRKGEKNLLGIFTYVFLCHLFIYCLSATNPPFCALLGDTRAGFYRLHFSLTSWLNVRPFQQRASERCCKSGRERRDYFFFQCFVFLLGGNWVNMQGSWQCFLEKKVVFWSSSKFSPTCASTLSPQRSESALQGPLF